MQRISAFVFLVGQRGYSILYRFTRAEDRDVTGSDSTTVLLDRLATALNGLSESRREEFFRAIRGESQREWITGREAVRLLNASYRRLYALVDAGRIGWRCLPGGSRRYRRVDVARLVEASTRAATEE